MAPKRNKSKILDPEFVYDCEWSSMLRNNVNNPSSSELGSILAELAAGISSLQQTMNNLSVNNNAVNNVVNAESQEATGAKSSTTSFPLDRSYIVNFKELGGSNVLFFPNGKLHPVLFLKKLKKIFEEAGVPDQHKLGLVMPCLKDTAADWAAIKESSFQSFADFEVAFLNRFWGVDKQRDLFLQINYGKYERGSQADYFLNLFNQASFLATPIPEPKLISLLSKHFSPDIQRGIITLGIKTFDELDEYLRNIDTIEISERNRVMNRGAGGSNNWRRNGHSGEARDQGSGDNRSDNRNMRNIQATKFNDDLDFSSESESDELGIEGSNDNFFQFKSPLVRAQVGNRKVDILVDSGSEITAISEKLYRDILGDMDIPTLPVTNLAIKVAIGGKQQRIKLQVLLPVVIPGACISFDVKCLVVPGLNRDVLFGTDWLLEYKVNMDFSKSVLRFFVKNKAYTVEYSSGCGSLNDGMELRSVDVSTCSGISSMPSGEIQVFRHKYTNEEMRAAAESAGASKAVKDKLFSLIQSYGEIFSDSPGCIKSYTHYIEMADDTPFQGHSYPIPMIYRMEVRSQIKEMLEWGVISKQKTNYISPLVTVKKKDVKL